jgi:hypothetical protein
MLHRINVWHVLLILFNFLNLVNPKSAKFLLLAFELSLNESLVSRLLDHFLDLGNVIFGNLFDFLFDVLDLLFEYSKDILEIFN